METEYLREYIVFAESLNYTIASKKLFISQPTLSAHINALEKTFGVDLVGKSSGKIFLTPAGKHFLGNAPAIINSVDHVIDECRTVDASVLQLNVSNNLPLYADVVDPACRYYSHTHPDKTVSFNTVPTPYGREEALRRGDIDLDIGKIVGCPEMGDPIEGLYPDLPEQYFLQQLAVTALWMTSDNRLYNKESIALDDLDGTTFLLDSDECAIVYGQQVAKLFALNGVMINLINQKFNSISEYYMTDLGNCIGMGRLSSTYSPVFMEPNALRRAFTIENFGLHMSVYTSYYEDRLDAKKLEFIDALKCIAQENINGEINA